MSSKKFSLYIVILFISLCIATFADAYKVDSCYTSEDGWGDPTTEFTNNSDAVYINIVTNTDFADEGISIKYKWYRPDGTLEDDVGTTLLAHRVRSTSGLLIGFWSYMAIKDKDRETGEWRVEHWAYGYSGGVLDWYLMCTTYFNITEAVANPTFSPPPGTYINPQKVTLFCSTSLATIHYTTDGTDPTKIAPIYSNPIDISKTTTIKARAYKSGLTASDIVSGTYMISKVMPWVSFLLLDEDKDLPVSGNWSGSADFGELSFTVHSTRTSITQLVINYIDFLCGGVLSNGSTTVTSSWPITDRQFNITTGTPDREITIIGTFDKTGEYASGIYGAVFNGTTCTGTWDATPN